MDLSFFFVPVNVMMFAMISFIVVCMIWYRDLPLTNSVKNMLSPKVEGRELEDKFGL